MHSTLCNKTILRFDNILSRANKSLELPFNVIFEFDIKFENDIDYEFLKSPLCNLTRCLQISYDGLMIVSVVDKYFENECSENVTLEKLSDDTFHVVTELEIPKELLSTTKLSFTSSMAIYLMFNSHAYNIFNCDGMINLNWIEGTDDTYEFNEVTEYDMIPNYEANVRPIRKMYVYSDCGKPVVKYDNKVLLLDSNNCVEFERDPEFNDHTLSVDRKCIISVHSLNRVNVYGCYRDRTFV